MRACGPGEFIVALIVVVFPGVASKIQALRIVIVVEAMESKS